MNNFRFWPEAASKEAAFVDRLSLSMAAMSILASLLIAGIIVWFVIRYRHTAKVNRKALESRFVHNFIEIVWMAVPLAILLGFFVVGTRPYAAERRPTGRPLELSVVGKQWMWKVSHETGQREINSLHLPLGSTVRLRMTSEDVIHSLFIPAFRTKQDVLPGRYTSLLFEPTKVGQYHLFCAEYCGTDHSRMIGTVSVMRPEEYAAWAVVDSEPPVSRGRRVYATYGCGQCHGLLGEGQEIGSKGGTRENTLGSENQAPSLIGLWNSQVQISDGTMVAVDADYLRRAIYDPQSQIVQGYSRSMPTFAGVIDAEELDDLVAYLQSLSELQPMTVSGKLNSPPAASWEQENRDTEQQTLPPSKNGQSGKTIEAKSASAVGSRNSLRQGVGK